MRMDKHQYYLNIALAVSKRSTCLKRHYGCVIVKDDMIIATGYNGSPRGEENCCDRGFCKRQGAERYSDYTKCDSVHAEQNALIAADSDKLIGATVYLACEQVTLMCAEATLGRKQACDGCMPNFENEGCCYAYDSIEIDENPVPCNICARMLKNARVSKVINSKGEVKFGTD